jgi:hypothetical protein
MLAGLWSAVTLSKTPPVHSALVQRNTLTPATASFDASIPMVTEHPTIFVSCFTERLGRDAGGGAGS